MTKDRAVIEFKSVTKIYKLYSSEKKRLLSVFFKKIPHKEKKAVDDVSFEIKVTLWRCSVKMVPENLRY